MDRNKRRRLLLQTHPDKNQGNARLFYEIFNIYPDILNNRSNEYNFDRIMDERKIDFSDIRCLKFKN